MEDEIAPKHENVNDGNLTNDKVNDKVEAWSNQMRNNYHPERNNKDKDNKSRIEYLKRSATQIILDEVVKIKDKINKVDKFSKGKDMTHRYTPERREKQIQKERIIHPYDI